MQTNLDYPPLATCLRQLDIALADSGSNAIVQAERDIDAFASHDSDLHRRAGHLHILRDELDRKWKGLEGERADFAFLVFEFIDKRMRELEQP
jgi:hypothetical protein